MALQALIGPAIGAVGSLIAGDQSAKAQKKAAQQAAASQEKIAGDQIAFQREMMDRQQALSEDARRRQAAQLYPRQRASNAALQSLTDLYGLGDIYAAPRVGDLAGQGAFYPENPFDEELARAQAAFGSARNVGAQAPQQAPRPSFNGLAANIPVGGPPMRTTPVGGPQMMPQLESRNRLAQRPSAMGYSQYLRAPQAY